MAVAERELIEHFGRNEWFTRSYWPENKSRTLRILRDVEVLGGRPCRVIDVGCGVGYMSFLMAKQGHTVVAVDGWELPRRDEWLGNNGVVFRYANFNTDRPLHILDSGSFDVAVCGEVIEHILHHPTGFLAEISRVVRPGGGIILTTPNPSTVMNAYRLLCGRYSLWGTEAFIAQPKFNGHGVTDIGDVHFREYRQAELVTILSEAGFGNIRATYHTNGANTNTPAWKRTIKMIAHPLFCTRLFGAAHYITARKVTG